jgi:membrane protein implicated in regulation of membrane protease activity
LNKPGNAKENDKSANYCNTIGRQNQKFMEQFAWILWVVLGIGLIIAEIFTFGFVLFCFGIGAIAAALAAWLGLGFSLQFLVFAVVSVALTVMSRTIFANYLRHGDKDLIKTGIDALPGKIGTVTSSSQGALKEGAVKVFGSTWTAFPADEETVLTEGEKVEVVSVEGASIYVRRISDVKELPEWRR